LWRDWTREVDFVDMGGHLPFGNLRGQNGPKFPTRADTVNLAFFRKVVGKVAHFDC